MELIKNIKIRMNALQMKQKIECVQNDNAIIIHVELEGLTLSSTRMSATLFVRKPSGKVVYQSAVVTNEYILVNLYSQALAEVGVAQAQVQVKEASGVITSFEFDIYVKESLSASSATQSTNVVDAVSSVIENTLKKYGSTDVETYVKQETVKYLNQHGAQAYDDTQIKQDIANKLSTPSGVGVGDLLSVKKVNDDGSLVLQKADMSIYANASEVEAKDVPVTWATGQTPQAFNIFRVGKAVHVYIRSASSAHAQNDVIGTISNDADRPSTQFSIPLISTWANEMAYGNISIETDGTIKIYGISKDMTAGRFTANGIYVAK